MGCFGSLPGIKTACAFAKLNKRNRVLMVSTEICSTHIEKELTNENFVSSAIFGDGSGF
jgi:alpha-pyrone synthase